MVFKVEIEQDNQVNVTQDSEHIELQKNEADKTILWERYKLWASEITDHFRIVMQFSIWYYAVTGVIVSFILNKPESRDLRIALMLPAIMGILSGGAYLYFVWRLRFTNDDLQRLAMKIFTYTYGDLKIINFVADREPYRGKPPGEKFLLAAKEAYEKYKVDGRYSYHTANHLQAALLILGLTHIMIGGFSIYLFCGAHWAIGISIISISVTGIICLIHNSLYEAENKKMYEIKVEPESQET